MNGEIHYPKPPIREAMLDFRCPTTDKVGPDLDSRLAELADKFAGEFSAHRTTVLDASERSSKAFGITLRQSPERFVWQIRRDGMLLSRLPIYTSWDEVAEFGRRLWSGYREAVHQAPVSELVVRAINEIRLPAGQVDLREFVRTYPHVSDEIAEPINRFAMNIGFPIGEPSGQANITLAPGVSQTFGNMALLLDITVMCRDTDAIEKDCWHVARQLRGHRNRIFEASITDKLRETFND
jgi:uncharacterized protein (TIGR04255 family)